ncbi:MAG TPA: sulfatase [Candidatus Binatia bacterium]|jgi:arylsulfatase A-like enzyme
MGRTRLLAIATAAAAAIVSCLPRGGSPHPNILLISIDTLRADHLGCYGYPVPTTPNIDAFAKASAVLFRTAVAAAPSTLPSHSSMFTSLLPEHHGAFFTRDKPLPADRRTIATILKGYGYRTASVNDGGQMDARYGVAQGFDEYKTLPGTADAAKFSRTVSEAFAWLDANSRSGPWFLFLHSYETHHPYTPERRYLDAVGDRYDGPLPDAISTAILENINDHKLVGMTDADKRHIIACYDAEIRSMDESFGVLVDGLKKRGLFDDTLIVFTSDHGEELGEHTRMGWHSHALWDPILLVPLIVALPDRASAGHTIGDQAREIDILPTVLDVIGAKPEPQAEGRSLMALVRGQSDDARPAVSQQDSTVPQLPATLRVDSRKLYVRISRPSMLFDLATDPGEQNDLSSERSAEADSMQARMDSLFAAAPTSGGAGSAVPDPALREKLRSLGYLGSDGAPADGAEHPAH